MRSIPLGDGGKTDARRNEDASAFARGYEGIDWNAREREAQASDFLAVEHDTPLSNNFYRRMVEKLAVPEPVISGWLREGPGDPVYIGIDLAAPEVPRVDAPHLFLGDTVTFDLIRGPTAPVFNPDDFGVIAVEHREEPDFSVPRPSWWRRAWDRVCEALTPCWDP